MPRGELAPRYGGDNIVDPLRFFVFLLGESLDLHFCFSFFLLRLLFPPLLLFPLSSFTLTIAQ